MGSIHSVSIQQADIDELGMRSATMPAHPDVPVGLKQLKDAGFRLVTLTNSPPDAQISQLRHAGIDGFFERLFSVDRVRRYKPAPQVYHMAAEELNVQTAAICLISVHVWDNLGAQNAGCSSALVARPGNAPPPALALPGVARPGGRWAGSSRRGHATDQALALRTLNGNVQNDSAGRAAARTPCRNGDADV